MKSVKTFLFAAVIICNLTAFSFAAQVIIDHTCTDIWQVPEEWVNQAKTDLHIAYGHTSHGRQLISGMGSDGVSLDQFMTATSRRKFRALCRGGINIHLTNRETWTTLQNS